MISEIRNVTVVGTGLVGSAWAAFFADHGFPVTMFDPTPEQLDRGYRTAIEQFEFLADRTPERMTPGAADRSLLRQAESLKEAVRDADLVVEAAPERYETKISLFADLDAATRPDCVLASSTSGLLMTRIQQGLTHPERTLVAHPFNPVHLVPLVELVAGDQTDPSLLMRMQQFYEGLGKVAVIVRREVPGFIGNRLQAAVWREAIQLVLDGVGTVEDVDRALCAGPGLRWALMGQHMIFHLGGGPGGIAGFIDHIGGKWGDLWDDMASWSAIPAEAKSALDAGVRDELQGRSQEEIAAWRDERLAAMLQVIREVDNRS